MSRAGKSLKAANNSQLKPDLTQAVKVLQGLLSGLEKIEAGLIDADQALDAESRYKEQLSKQESRIRDLQNDLEVVKRKGKDDVTSFTTATLKLSEDFRTRMRNQSIEYESKLEESKKQKVESERQLKETLKSEADQIDDIKAKEKANQRHYEMKLKETKQLSKDKEGALHAKLQEAERKVADLLERNQTLVEDLDQVNTIQRGHETEMKRLTKKLTTLEAFSPKSKEETSNLFTGLQDKLQDFCNRCVDSAEVPLWNQFPEEFQQKGLPQWYTVNSGAGRRILFVAIQHSICTVMVENIFISPGLNLCREFVHFSKALYQNNRSHEAIWRLMTAKVILGDQQILEGYKRKFRKTAYDLLAYWKLFLSENIKDEFLGILSTILFDAFQTWWYFMTFRDKIYICTDAASRNFVPDVEERPVEVPGGFTVSDSTSTFCLFPALLEVTSEDRSGQPQLLRQGTMMYPNSPSLLSALNEEEQKMKSPRLSNRKFS